MIHRYKQIVETVEAIQVIIPNLSEVQEILPKGYIFNYTVNQGKYVVGVLLNEQGVKSYVSEGSYIVRDLQNQIQIISEADFGKKYQKEE